MMIDPPPSIEYLCDNTRDESLDPELRALIKTCFPDAPTPVFHHWISISDPFTYRWVIREREGALVAHLSMSQRTLLAKSGNYEVGRLTEVCVHPDFRGRGYLKALLGAAHRWMRERNYAFAVVLGDLRYYASSGYVAPLNLYHDSDENGERTPCRTEGALVAPLSDIPWPDTRTAYLPGLMF